MADGSIRVAPALYEPGRRYALSPSMRATGDGGGFRLSGAKILVPGAATPIGCCCPPRSTTARSGCSWSTRRRPGRPSPATRPSTTAPSPMSLSTPSSSDRRAFWAGSTSRRSMTRSTTRGWRFARMRWVDSKGRSR
ncbi:hypothetical protein ACFSTI_23150 [Rhizorhabdus histidinilytica]